MDDIIELVDLTKRWETRDREGRLAWKTAVDGLSLSVGRGEVFGLLGPNGAGKTTTIRMLTLQTRPTSGEIRVGGIPVQGHEQETKQLIGVVPQHVNFDQDLTAEENMELHARLHHMDSVSRRQRIRELLDYIGLSDRAGESVRKLSGGMKRRLLIARALIHRPSILFLDEPTVALDPQVRRRIWSLIRQMAKDGATVVLTTHYIEEAESLCGRVAVMDRGKLIALDAPQRLCDRLGRFTAEWDADGDRASRFFRERGDAAAFAAGLPGAVRIRPTNLEDAFIELTGGRTIGASDAGDRTSASMRVGGKEGL